VNAHKNLPRRDVMRHGAEKIALMAASEFHRAAKRSHSMESVQASFERGRELMGILETISIPDRAARRLKVIFARASLNQLQTNLPQDRIAKIANEIADELERPF
jgi:hypothetical protein